MSLKALKHVSPVCFHEKFAETGELTLLRALDQLLVL
jgi:hypothetical protein